MIFTVLGAVAELERSLIQERVKAGLRNAKAKGRHVGRPKVSVDAARIATLRDSGASWRFVEQDHSTTGAECWNSQASLLQPVQKPFR
jgi:DNA invertase Pin-like site-specific DNA recombinase